MYAHTKNKTQKNQISISLLKDAENILLIGQFYIHFYKKQFNFQR